MLHIIPCMGVQIFLTSPARLPRKVCPICRRDVSPPQFPAPRGATKLVTQPQQGPNYVKFFHGDRDREIHKCEHFREPAHLNST